MLAIISWLAVLVAAAFMGFALYSMRTALAMLKKKANATAPEAPPVPPPAGAPKPVMVSAMKPAAGFKGKNDRGKKTLLPQKSTAKTNGDDSPDKDGDAETARDNAAADTRNDSDTSGDKKPADATAKDGDKAPADASAKDGDKAPANASAKDGDKAPADASAKDGDKKPADASAKDGGTLPSVAAKTAAAVVTSSGGQAGGDGISVNKS